MFDSLNNAYQHLVAKGLKSVKAYPDPAIFVKRPNLDRVPADLDLANNPLLKEDSDLIKALEATWKRIGKSEGLSAVLLEPAFDWVHYDMGENPGFNDLKGIWIAMTAVKGGVPYFIDFDLDGFAAGMRYWSTVPTSARLIAYGSTKLVSVRKHAKRSPDLERKMISALNESPELRAVHFNYLQEVLSN